MDDDLCKALSDLVRSSMKQCDGDPEPITSWGLYVGWLRAETFGNLENH